MQFRERIDNQAMADYRQEQIFLSLQEIDKQYLDHVATITDLQQQIDNTEKHIKACLELEKQLRAQLGLE